MCKSHVSEEKVGLMELDELYRPESSPLLETEPEKYIDKERRETRQDIKYCELAFIDMFGLPEQ